MDTPVRLAWDEQEYPEQHVGLQPEGRWQSVETLRPQLKPAVKIAESEVVEEVSPLGVDAVVTACPLFHINLRYASELGRRRSLRARRAF